MRQGKNILKMSVRHGKGRQSYQNTKLKNLSRLGLPIEVFATEISELGIKSELFCTRILHSRVEVHFSQQKKIYTN